VGDFWRAAMDTKRLDDIGLQPLRADLDQIDALTRAAPGAAALGELSARLQLRFAASPLLNVGVIPDARDSRTQLLVIIPGFQSLTPDEYSTPAGQRIRELYTAHIARMFQSTGDSAEAAAAAAGTVLAIEAELAAARLTPTQQRDPARTYNKMSLAEAQALVPAIDLGALLGAMGVGPLPAVQVFDLEGTRAVQKLLATRPPAELRLLLRWHLLNAGASLLGQPWRGMDQAFSRDRQGLASSPPREQEIVRAIGAQLYHPLSQLYVEAYFPPHRREEITQMVARIKSEFERRLHGNPWLDEPTRAAALDKLAQVDIQVGYPARWIDFSSVSIRPDDHFGNSQRIAEFLARRDVARAGQPVRVDRFAAPGQTTPIAVNAAYSPQANNIDITAAIVQPPFYTPGADAAVNYCTMGAVIGHELTHGFDSFGRQFGPAGNLRDWWTPQAAARFRQRTDVLVQQYGRFTILPGLMHNGAQTITENTADLGGISIAHAALRRELAGRPDRRIDGLSADQRCFVAWAQLWSFKARPERLRVLVATDFHSVSSLRGFAPLLHLDAFHQAFGTRPGDPMWRAPKDRVRIW
jgi:putative endopeptidase